MVVTGASGVSRQGPGQAAFTARPGTVLRFFLSSGSNNFETPAVLVGLTQAGGDLTLGPCELEFSDRVTVVPGSPVGVLPAGFVSHTFQFLSGSVAAAGRGIYEIVFLLYASADTGELKQIGQYRWAMQLTINETKETP